MLPNSIHLRFSSSQDLDVARVIHAGIFAQFVSLAQPLFEVWRTPETSRENQIRLANQLSVHVPQEYMSLALTNSTSGDFVCRSLISPSSKVKIFSICSSNICWSSSLCNKVSGQNFALNLLLSHCDHHPRISYMRLWEVQPRIHPGNWKKQV